MDLKLFSAVSVLLLTALAIVGFFLTKRPGFGKFSVSTLLMLLVLGISSLFYATDLLQSQPYIAILSAIVGFAGGLFANRAED